MIPQNIENGIKLKKLKLAKKLAYTKSKKQKVKKTAENFESEIDEKIKSIALNKFIIRKQKKLSDLGKTKAEISELISEIQVNEENIVEKKLSELKGFGIDKNFVGLSADEILGKINVKPVIKEKDEQPNNFKIKDATINNENSEKSENSENEESQFLLPNKVEKALDITVDKDTDTIEDVEENNEKIYDYLVKKGETDIADYILDLMTKNEEPIKRTSEINKDLKSHTNEIKKLSLINSGIYEELKTLQENQVDEQDTSVSIPEKLQEKSAEQHFKTDDSNIKKDEKSGFWNLMKNLGLAKMLQYFSGLFSNKKFMKAIEFIKAGNFSGLLKHLGGLKGLTAMLRLTAGSLLAIALKPIKGAIGLINVALIPLKALKATVENLINMLPNIPVIGKYFKSFKSVQGEKLDDKKIDKTQKAKKAKLNGELPENKLSDNTKKVGEKVEKPKKPKIQKLSDSKIGGKGATKLTKKATAKGGSKIVTKLLKFAKFVPFLGAALTAGTAVYAAQDGYRNADKILGTPKSKLKPIHKLAAGAGAAIEDLLWPVSPEASTTAALVLRAAGKMGMDITPNEDANIKDNVKSLNNTNSDFINKPEKSNTNNAQNTDITIPKDESKLNGLSGDVQSIERQIEEIKAQQKELTDKYGQRSGNRMYNNMYSEKIKKLTALLEKERSKKPDVVKNNRIQQIENNQKSLVNSSVQFSKNKSANIAQGVSDSININSINQNNPQKVVPSVLDAFEN